MKHIIDPDNSVASMKKFTEFDPPHSYFAELVMGYRRAKVVFVASKVGLFACLAKHPAGVSAETIAADLSLDRRATRVLLRALVGLGLVRNEGDVFHSVEAAADYLVPGGARYVGNNLEFQDMIWECWSGLEATLRSGKPHASLLSLLEKKDGNFTRDYIRGMANISARTSKEVADVVTAKRSGLRAMLDVGCGPGTFSYAMMRAQPTLRGTLFDLPTTLEITREFLEQAGFENRAELVPGDYTRAPFGTGYDFALLSHVTHDESPDTNRDMLRRVHASLNTGALVAIHDFVIDSRTFAPSFSSLFGVNMLTYTLGGETYRNTDYETWLRETGFDDISMHTIAANSGNESVLFLAARR